MHVLRGAESKSPTAPGGSLMTADQRTANGRRWPRSRSRRAAADAPASARAGAARAPSTIGEPCRAAALVGERRGSRCVGERAFGPRRDRRVPAGRRRPGAQAKRPVVSASSAQALSPSAGPAARSPATGRVSTARRPGALSSRVQDAAVQARHRRDEAQAEAEAGAGAGALQAHEALEDMAALGLRDAGSAIGDRDDDVVAARGGPRPRWLRSRRRRRRAPYLSALSRRFAMACPRSSRLPCTVRPSSTATVSGNACLLGDGLVELGDVAAPHRRHRNPPASRGRCRPPGARS